MFLMKLKVVTGSTIYESTKNIFSGIDTKDKTTPYFVVVPDRFTLQAEKLLFETLNIKSTFNINIVGLSSLAGKVIKDCGLKELSQMEGTLIIQKIFLDNKDKFTYFKKFNSALCFEVYKTIEQIKSSNIKPEQIKINTRSENLNNKIEDVKFIYEQYEKQRLDRLDREDVIEVFAQKIEEKQLYKDSIFVFAGFDSFTSTNFGVISALCKNVKELWFAVNKPKSVSNAFVYEGDILGKLKVLAQSNSIPVEIISPIEEIEENRDYIMKNLFAREINSKDNNNYLFVASSNSKREEVLFVARAIKKAIFSGARFKDFAILCPNIEAYQDEINVCFKNFNITKHVDLSKKFSDTILARFVKKCFSLVKKNFAKEEILYFLSSPLLDIEDRAEKIAFVNEKNISGREKFDYFISSSNALFKDLLLLNDEDEYSAYAYFIQKALDEVLTNLEKHIEKEKEFGYIQESSFDEQSIEALKEVCETFKNIKEKVVLNDFISILLTALDNKKISALPSFCDQVFVGNSTDSFYSKTKTLFVLGANAGQLPQNSNDAGLLTDGEIEESCFNKILSPTIKMVNKRNRFKLFSSLSQATDRLVISYLNFNEEGQKQEKAYFVNSLMKIFNLESKHIIQTNDIQAESLENLLFFLGNKETAKNILGALEKNKNEFVGSVKEVLNYDEEKNHLKREYLSKDLAERAMFPKGYAKVTQIEKYYDCPFKHFVENSLKPSQKLYAEIKPNIYGTIMHSLLEDFVKKFAKTMGEIDDSKIKEFIEKNIDKYLDENIVDFLPDKDLFIKEIKENSFKLCKRAGYEITNSKFVPTYFEKRFDGENLNIAGRDVVGFVDRVDICDDMFRVIDYKTGKITSSILSSLYYGKKLQLFLYGTSLRKELGLDFSGAFYFDAKVSYAQNEKQILKGVYKPTEKVLYALDKRFENPELKKSDLVKMERTKDGFSKATLSQVKLNDLEEYAVAVSKKALNQIKEGNIKPCPSKESCEYCEYRGLCLLNKGEKERDYRNMEDYFKREEGENEQV